MKVCAEFRVERLVQRDIVVASDDNLGLKVSLLKPLHSFGKLHPS
jgi:hypothetical protein